MTEILTVDAVDTAADRAVLASLPRHFRRGPGDVHLVHSGESGWADRLAGVIRGGARGALLTGAGTAEPDVPAALAVLTVLAELAELAASSGVPVVVDVRFGHDPTWAAALPRISLAEVAIVDGLGHGGHPVDVLVGQLALLRSLLPTGSALRAAHRSATSYAVCGEIDGTVVNLAGAAALPGAPPLRIQVAGLDCRWEAVFDDAAVATPTVVTRMDAAGSVTLPLVYEGSRRCAWRALHRAVVDRAPVRYGLAELLADRTLALDMLGGSP